MADWNGRAERVGLADIERKFELKVERLGRAERGSPIGSCRTGLAGRTEDWDTAGKDGRGATVVSDWNVLIVVQQWLIWAKECAYAGGVMDGGVKVRVVRYFHGSEKNGAVDRVKGGLGSLPLRGRRADVKERGDGLAEKCPRVRTEFHKRVQGRRLAGPNQTTRQKVRRGALIEVEQMRPNGDAKVTLIPRFEYPVGEMSQGEVSSGFIG